MYSAIVSFVYNRQDYTEKTLKALTTFEESIVANQYISLYKNKLENV